MNFEKEMSDSNAILLQSLTAFGSSVREVFICAIAIKLPEKYRIYTDMQTKNNLRLKCGMLYSVSMATKTSISVDVALWKKFKAYAKRNRRSVTKQLDVLMQEAVSSDKSKKTGKEIPFPVAGTASLSNRSKTNESIG